MPAESLTTRRLGRATLARQLLLARRSISPSRAIERLAGLQAQQAQPPFLGLWSRVAGFRREALHRLLHRRKVVRAPLMRHTLHLVTARDYRALRGPLQPVLTRALASALRKRAAGIDVPRLTRDARVFLDDAPRTFQELRAHLAPLHPAHDDRALGYAVRSHLPVVQVPTDSRWAFPASAAFAAAATYLDAELDITDERPHDIVRRYLAAFGPATAADVQTWSGLTGVRAVLEELRPALRVLRDDRDRELFDVPRAPLPEADVPAPARLLPAYDNLVLAHADRSRLMDDGVSARICTKNLRVLPTFLVDGRVAGTWRTERARRTARLVLEPFDGVSTRARRALTAEAEALLGFAEEDAETFEVSYSA
jgi:hypothetical protein